LSLLLGKLLSSQMGLPSVETSPTEERYENTDQNLSPDGAYA
jgi:hypothetical protein